MGVGEQSLKVFNRLTCLLTETEADLTGRSRTLSEKGNGTLIPRYFFIDFVVKAVSQGK